MGKLIDSDWLEDAIAAAFGEGEESKTVHDILKSAPDAGEEIAAKFLELADDLEVTEEERSTEDFIEICSIQERDGARAAYLRAAKIIRGND